MELSAGSVGVVICAAGTSNRMGGKKKEYLPLPSPAEKSLTVLGAVVRAFVSCPQTGPIVISVSPGDETGLAMACLPPELYPAKLPNGQTRIAFVPGGKTRRSSVHKALLFMKSYNPSQVLVHDGARPWIKKELIEKIIDAAIKYRAVIPALPLLETPKEIYCDTEFPGLHFIRRHLRRQEFWTAQTPQGFAFAELLAAHEKAREKEEKENFEYTDDAEVWGEFAGQVAVIPGDPANRKITFPEDLR
jgi:2-C-methyl-D-erythritol 4-phosphate cytidylyltransferase/2-C-methyl-D-erythritol 4-phosphate cytidylyltransferase/2-C-methyl-D-erythritol 2,4-cyclodiphosphate synthase